MWRTTFDELLDRVSARFCRVEPTCKHREPTDQPAVNSAHPYIITCCNQGKCNNLRFQRSVTA
jgi:hypothetical protein